MQCNKVFLAGRLTRDIELKKTQTGKSVVSFQLAVPRKKIKDQEQVTDFISCVAWTFTADYLAQYCFKGDEIFVEARMETRSYQNKEGNNVTITEAVIDNAQKISFKNNNTNNATTTNNNSYPNIKASNSYIDDIDMGTSKGYVNPEDLPF